MKIFTLERREKQKTFRDEKKSLIFFCSFCLCLRHEKLSINFLPHRRLRLLAAETQKLGYAEIFSASPGVSGSGNLRIKNDFRVESFSVTFRAEHHNSVDADVSLIFHWQSFVTSEREKDYS